MPSFEPFRALRYAPGTNLDLVIAPPYDVLSPADVADLAGRDAYNIVHVDMPAGGEDRYDRAAELLRSWIEQGVLVRDAEPSFTIYRMRFTDEAGQARDIAGVFGALGVGDPESGGALPHERTTPKAKTDRLDLTRATRANMSPVWGLALAHGLTDAIREPGEPVGSLVVDGVEHVVERVTDPARIAAISAAASGDDVLIADGHHRYAISRVYRDERHAAEGPGPNAADATLAFVNELVADQLSIEAIHRVYRAVTADELEGLLAASFTVSEAPAASPALLPELVRRGALVLVRPDGSSRWLDPKPEVFADVRALDGAYLEHALASTAAEVAYQHGVAEVLEVLRSGEATAAILIRPTSMAEIERTAREGLLMPPKSTFFTPKLRTGLVVREVD